MVYSEEGTGRGRSPPRPLLAVPNVTAHPSTASVPITVLLYNGPLLCGFNVVIKGYIAAISRSTGNVQDLFQIKGSLGIHCYVCNKLKLRVLKYALIKGSFGFHCYVRNQNSGCVSLYRLL